MFEKLRELGFTIATQHHAEAILQHDLPSAVEELTEALSQIEIPVEEIVRGGGGESDVTQRLRRALAALGWNKHTFKITKIIDEVPKESLTHLIDHVRRMEKGTLAFEIEWNNKDPFFDRDLENFKRLHSEGAISVGGIITRDKSLQDAFRSVILEFARSRGIKSAADLKRFYTPTPRQLEAYTRRAAALGNFAAGWTEAFVSDKFGEATTHWRKLEERLHRNVGSPCPLLLIGIPASVLRQ